MTHDDLVAAAVKWVRARGSCGVVFHELTTLGGEIADVIGFGSDHHSVLVECKISRKDFFADQRKSFRLEPSKGMGLFRLYCSPKDVINVEDLPAGWGLIWVDEHGRAKAIKNPMRQPWEDRERWRFDRRNDRAERQVLYSALRRISIRNVQIIEEIYQPRPES